MRKASMLFALLLVVGMGGMLYAHSALTASQTEVSFVELASYGDVAAAAGLEVSVQAQLAEHLAWDSVYTFGKQAATKTDFKFSTTALQWRPDNTSELLSISIPSDLSVTTSGSMLDDTAGASAPGPEFDSFIVLLRDVASRTNNGESHKETVNYKDYYDYYPISVDLWTEPEQYYSAYDDKGEQYIGQMTGEGEMSRAFGSYFKIPVLEDDRITVEITKDTAGNVVGMSTSKNSPVWLSTVSAKHENGIYFALQMEDGLTDYSEITGGFGIYLLPASTIEDDDGNELPTLDYEKLSTVYSLSETAKIYRLFLSEDKSCLNLITMENDNLLLTVIDMDTMADKQVLPLFTDVASEAGLQTASYVDGLLFVLLNDGRFVLAGKMGDNTYRTALSGVRNMELLNEDSFSGGYFRWFEPVLAWDGKRLALITATQRFVPRHNDVSIGYSYDTCGFMVEVFRQDGLAYKGIYHSSLDALATQDNYNGRVRLIDTGALSLGW